MSQTKAQLIDPVDGTITNADISSGASDRIAGTKISPDFGSQNVATTGNLGSGNITVTSATPAIIFTESDANPDFQISGSGGVLRIEDVTNGYATRFAVNTDGHVDVLGNLDVGSGVDVTGDLSVTGEVQIAENIVHTGDGNTSIGFSANDTVSIKTGGTERFKVEDTGTTVSTTTDASFFINSSASGGAHIRIQSSGTNKSFFGQAEGIAGALGGANDFALRSAGAINFAPNDTNAIKVKIDTSGRLLIGTTTEGNAFADDLTIATDAQTGITIRSGSSSTGNIYFSDATSGTGEAAGYFEYNHNGNALSIGTNEDTRFVIGSAGQLGIGSTPSYGNAGEALVSQGNSAAPQWATVSSITTGSNVSVAGFSDKVLTGIPANAKIVRLLFQNLYSTGSGRPMFRVGHAASGGTLITSGYKGYSGYYYENRTSFAPNNEVNQTFIPVVHSAWNHSSYRWNGYLDLVRVYADSSNQSQLWTSVIVLRENATSYWSSHQVFFYNRNQIYMGDNISLDRISIDANGSGSGETLVGNVNLQYFT